ncbi:5'-methylthioadenosine/S-adenosylhomocysteine nucleosidase 2 [Seminavis robusta]|uniref:5'-methylthioadenosine/S-adenosylhomocysteine nucleosidase 2 n=1 Tax=Seminavis robusta TaxID=568900 RepID=A0A9N8EFY2_9STRA|nr:5'-methylthioadenosine/S-adenosylhomocysteine nucleosidase 2 [Seminavis robusta]|eukprot:Sro1099_g241140.1 5'-methylthioadenosine/S-adenosylhomocysteine nucleosidase 2 (252) ;mRNA; r:23271-24276
MAIEDVIVAIAMEAEAKPFIDHLGLKKDESFFPPHTPFVAFTGTHNQCKVTVVFNGKDTVYNTGVDNVGTVPASIATFLALNKMTSEAPDKEHLLINAGTCGGFKRKGAEIGDVFLTTAVANHDRRIPIPDFVPLGIGKLETVNATKMAEAFSYKTGVCTTGNSLDKTEKDDELMLANDASVKDMEAAAIAWSCKLHNVPFLGVKVVTDIVDGGVPTQDEFLENLQSASKSLQGALPKVLDYVCGKTHSEL